MQNAMWLFQMDAQIGSAVECHRDSRCRAKALSFIFLRTHFASILASDLFGLTRTSAVMNG
jgi:hypothetical protein